jgi:hypothetical protein
MKSSIKKTPFSYKPKEKPEYKTTSFRLTVELLNNLEDFAEEEETSVNDLASQILEWGFKNRVKK